MGSRINTTSKHDGISINEAIKNLPAQTETLTLISDNWCQLYGVKKPKHLVRRIEVVRKDTNETFVFVTNIGNLTASDITELYRRR